MNISTAAINTKSVIKEKSSAAFMTLRSEASVTAELFIAPLGIFY